MQIVPGGYVPAEPEPEVVKTAPVPAAEAREAPPTPPAHPGGLPPASSGGTRTVSVERIPAQGPVQGPRPGSPGSKSRLSRLLHSHVL